MKAIIYMLRSGLKHYRPPGEGETVFYWDPKQKVLYPKSGSLSGFDCYVLVDSNVTTGRTVLQAIEALKLPYEKIRIRANPRTELAEKLVDEPMPDEGPERDKVLLVFSGPAASLKTFLARGLNAVHNIPVIECGEELKKLNVDLGLYGERLHSKEEDNPFLVGELLFPVLQKRTEKAVIVDGVKRPETVWLLSYATRRPAFVFYVYCGDEKLRRSAIDLRADPDDAYAEQRDLLFREGLNRLWEEAYAEIDISRWETLETLCAVLEALGYRTSEIAGLPNPFGSKRPILELYRRNVLKLVGKLSQVDEDFSEQTFHHSYVERLEERGISLPPERREVVELTASAFRIIDDILDEHKVRDNAPTFWVQHGIVKAVFVAVAMTAKAWLLAQEAGLGDAFLKMFRLCVDAVLYELLVEEGVEGFETFEDWLKAAEREAAFREFLAYVANMPERAQDFRAWGLHAQAKDDLIGSEKGGRENTDIRLNRPLFKPEWVSKLPPRPKDV